MEETKIKISAVVTALNEEEDIHQAISAILNAFKDFDIVFPWGGDYLSHPKRQR